MDLLPPRITCIGLARVDVIANVSDDFLLSYGIAKGASNFLDACSTGTILSRLESPTCSPGGSAANTACGVEKSNGAKSGIDVRFIGKTGDDGYGDIFRSGFAHTEVKFDTKPSSQKITSVCLTLVTPDKCRTTAHCSDTAGWFITPDDLPENANDGSIYLEANTGLMPIGGGRTLLEEAANRYHNAPMVIGMNDSAVVESCRAIVGSLLARQAPTWFIGNRPAVNALFQTDDFDAVCARIHAASALFAITSGADGAYIVGNGSVYHAAAEPLPDSRIVNTVGAGDQFAAGLLSGLMDGSGIEAACSRGVHTATFVLQQIDARPRHRRIA